jgi:phosphopantothenoylcysteine decarboxylase/phosphopantothenate--cysteine ligase
MESRMYLRTPVQANLDALRQSGYTFVGPECGPLASGASGVGRMAEPEAIVAALERMLVPRGALSGRTLVVTAGRTEEDIDPVRFITNRSTGKMGYAIADRALSRGAQVVLVTGPSALAPPDGAVVVRVRTVAEMEAATRKAFSACDALVMTAAVLDFRAESVSESKIKKQAGPLAVRFVPTHDFLVDLGREKGNRIVIGFAMETQDPEAGALGKLRSKHLDLIVLNDLTVEGAGFGVDTNVVTLFDRFGTRTALPKMTKAEVADRVLDWIEGRWSAA